MKLTPFLWILFLLILAMGPFASFSQANRQRELLERAYETKSYDLLGQFFDNWQREYTDNEAETPDKWLAEAHKVYAAILRPEITSEIGIEVLGPVLILQNSLDIIGCVNKKSMAFKEGDLDKTIYVTVDSAVDFRPKYQIEGLTTVYLTEGYKTILNDYLTFIIPPLKTETFDDWELVEEGDTLTMTGNEKEPYDYEEAKLQEELERIIFLRDYAGSIFCYWLFRTEVVSFFTIDKIIFDRSLQHAVVEYHHCHYGGIIVLKKIKDNWLFDHQYSIWIDS